MEENLPESPHKCKECEKNKNKKLKNILIEVVLLATVVGFIPELLITGLTDLWGPCPFNADICTMTKYQGLIKLFGAFACAVLSVVLGFIISKEFNNSEGK